MSIYNSDNEYPFRGFSVAKIVGAFLALVGTGVIIWTVVEISQLFTASSAFIFLDDMISKEISFVLENGSLQIPREILVYGIPLWALTTTARIGITLMRSGLQFIDMPRKNKDEKPSQ